MTAKKSRCIECGKLCETEEESFDYPDTHCNYGKAGTHYTGTWVSGCCGAETTQADLDYADFRR